MEGEVSGDAHIEVIELGKVKVGQFTLLPVVVTLTGFNCASN